MDFPAGPGVDLSGVFTPDSRCGALRRELWRLIKPAIDAGERLEAHPIVQAHLGQLHFAGERFSSAAIGKMQASRGRGNGEFPGPDARPCSEQKPEGLSTTRAAELAEMTPRSIRNLIHRGHLKGWQVKGGRLRVDIASLAEWISENREESDSGAE